MSFKSTEGVNLNSSDNQNVGFAENANIHFTIAAICAIGLCLFGMVGNVTVFWYLCFKIQKNKYTVYIINLAVANFIFLIFTASIMIVQINSLIGANPDFKGKESVYLALEICYDSSQYCVMFLLTAISMQKCLSVYFSSWYQTHRPKKLSEIVCICLWILSCSVSLIENLVCSAKDFMAQTAACTGVELMTFIISICICLPLMVISSVTLLFRIRRDYRQMFGVEYYIFIIAAVFVFILSVTPFNLFWFLMYFNLLPSDALIVSLFYASVFCTVLNSTLNPYIYLFAERLCKKGTKTSVLTMNQSISNETCSTSFESTWEPSETKE